MTSYLDRLIAKLAYLAYIRMYEIDDLPPELTEIYLSDGDNYWNTSVPSIETLENKCINVIDADSLEIKLSDRNNQWNSKAFDMESKQQEA